MQKADRKKDFARVCNSFSNGGGVKARHFPFTAKFLKANKFTLNLQFSNLFLSRVVGKPDL
jgi:hypothetical protein